MAASEENLGYRNIRRLIDGLERIDDNVIEAAEDLLRYDLSNAAESNLWTSLSEADLNNLRVAHNAYKNAYKADDMLAYLRTGISDHNRLFDTIITFIIRRIRLAVSQDVIPWLDWYNRTLASGDTTWKHAVPATHQFINAIGTSAGLETINAITVRLASLDRVLDTLNSLLEVHTRTMKFSEEFQDTLQAIVAISQTQGPYAPLDMPSINVVKSELRRRRIAESESTSTPSREQNLGASTGPDLGATALSPESLLSADDTNKPAAAPPGEWNSTITATVAVLFAVIISAIPGYKAWQYSPRKPGTTLDADFWFLVQSSMMQLVGLLTIILPLALSGRLLFRKWFWTWLLVGVSFSCSVAPIPVYLYFPTEWSATIGFLGSAAQVFVTLQALFIANKEKTQ